MTILYSFLIPPLPLIVILVIGKGRKRDSGCGTVDRTVTFDTKHLRFESSCRHNLYVLSTILKRQKIMKKRQCLDQFKKGGRGISECSNLKVPSHKIPFKSIFGFSIVPIQHPQPVLNGSIHCSWSHLHLPGVDK